MTGYQETLTDPSYAGQMITFTFPHIGNVGANPADTEAATHRGAWPGGAGGCDGAIQLARHPEVLTRGCGRRSVPGLAGVDTRALTMRIRDGGRRMAC